MKTAKKSKKKKPTIKPTKIGDGRYGFTLNPTTAADGSYSFSQPLPTNQYVYAVFVYAYEAFSGQSGPAGVGDAVINVEQIDVYTDTYQQTAYTNVLSFSVQARYKEPADANSIRSHNKYGRRIKIGVVVEYSVG